eukprot:Opistho-2@87891
MSHRESRGGGSLLPTVTTSASGPRGASLGARRVFIAASLAGLLYFVLCMLLFWRLDEYSKLEDAYRETLVEVSHLKSQVERISERDGLNPAAAAPPSSGGLDDPTTGMRSHGTRALFGMDVLPTMTEAQYDALIEQGTSMWCTGDTKKTRICRAKNICYAPRQGEFVVLHGNSTVISGVPKSRYEPALLDMASLDDHNTQYFHYIDLPVSSVSKLKPSNFAYADGTNFLFRRFHASNIMHVLHDDLIPLFHTMRQYAPSGKSAGLYSEHTRLVMMEGWSHHSHFGLYHLLAAGERGVSNGMQYDSRNNDTFVGKIILVNEFARDKLTCFQDAVIGLSKETTWYQYGFTEPQGPIPDKQGSGVYVRHFVDHIRRLLNAKPREYPFAGPSSSTRGLPQQLLTNSNHKGQANNENRKGDEVRAAAIREGAEANARDAGEGEEGETEEAKCAAMYHAWVERRAGSGPDYKTVARKADDTVAEYADRVSQAKIKAELEWSVAESEEILQRDNNCPIVAIFSRTRNRLLLNQLELAIALEDMLEMPVLLVSMETHPFESLARILSRTALAVSLHGSMLAMAMFMPRGSAVIELFPFGIPAENYTPYKTLAGLDGMQIAYRAWVNKNESATVGHAYRPANQGGLNHLSKEMREKVINTPDVPTHLCCSDPHWLYRIYQDTYANVRDVLKLCADAIQEAKTMRSWYYQGARTFLPAPVRAVSCGSTTKNTITVQWNAPWNAQYLKNLEYQVYAAETNIAYVTSATRVTIEGLHPETSSQFWVRAGVALSRDEDAERLYGPFSPVLVCTTAHAVPLKGVLPPVGKRARVDDRE